MSILTFAIGGGEPSGLPSLALSQRSRALLLALALAGLTLAATVLLVRRHRADADVDIPVTNYAALFRDSRGLPMGLNLMPSPAESHWGLSKRVRAVRLGARLADLEMVARARNGAAHASYYDRNRVANWVVIRNSDLVDRFAGELAAGFDDVAGERSAAAWYRIIQASGRDWATVDNTELRAAREWALGFRPGLFVLGEWLETGRAAALRRDGAFFARQESRAVLAAAVSLPQLPLDAQAALQRTQSLTGDRNVADFPALEHALTSALAALTH